MSEISSIYSAADAEDDCSELLRDFDAYFDSSLDINQFNLTVVDTDADVLNSLASHLESLRFAKFAAAALHSEICNISQNATKGCNKMDGAYYNGPDLHMGKSHFFTQLPFEVDLHQLSNMSNTLCNAYESEISMKQLTRDLERDRVVVNGRRLVGAANGLDGLVAAVGDCIDWNMAHCGLPPLSSALRRKVSLSVLRMACRTNSGGLCFHALRALLGKDPPLTYVDMPPPSTNTLHITLFFPSLCMCRPDPAEVMLVPLSTLARPLAVKITVEAFMDHSEEGGGITRCSPSNRSDCLQDTARDALIARNSSVQAVDTAVKGGTGKMRWGLCCEVRASTFFNLTSIDDHDHDHDGSTGGTSNGVEAVYTNLLCLEIDAGQEAIQDADMLGGLSPRGVCGQVQLRALVVPPAGGKIT